MSSDLLEVVSLTDSAVKYMKNLCLEQGDQKNIRLNIQAGGCSGFSYSMSFSEKKENDIEFNFDGVILLVNKRLLKLIKGLEINYSGGLQGKGFEYKNPNATSTCGCGTSFNYR